MPKMKIRPIFLVPIIAIVAMGFVTSYAATLQVTQSSVNGASGNYFVSNNVFTFANAAPQYQVAASSPSASSSPVTWASGGSIYVNAVTAGHWTYVFTTTIATATAGTYTVTITINQAGTATTYSIGITITGTSSGAMTLYIDLGTSINTPIATEVTA